MFHKPLNTMTTTRDPMGRKTIYDVLAKKYKNLKQKEYTLGKIIAYFAQIFQ